MPLERRFRIVDLARVEALLGGELFPLWLGAADDGYTGAVSFDVLRAHLLAQFDTDSAGKQNQAEILDLLAEVPSDEGDRLIYFSSPGVLARTPLELFGRNLLGTDNVEAAREMLGIPSSAFIRRTEIAVSTPAFVLHGKTKWLRLRGVAAGGGGGGYTTGQTTRAYAGGGGGAGEECDVILPRPTSGVIAFTTGIAGAGTDANGGAGGNSTYSDGVLAFTLKGGLGGQAALGALDAAVVQGGAAAQFTPTPPVRTCPGAPGGISLAIGANAVSNAIPVAFGGVGGSGSLGAGGLATAAGTAVTWQFGNPGIGFGSGGSGGAKAGITNAVTGGNGAGPLWIVEEFG